MAASRRKRLNYKQQKADEIHTALQFLGQNARDFLEGVLVAISFSPDPYTTAFNEGRRDLAREIMEHTLPETQTKIERNVTDGPS